MENTLTDAGALLGVARLLGLNTSWTLSFVFGAVVIVLFARRQLNRWDGLEDVEPWRARLLERLAPEQTRSRRVFMRALALYAGLLLTFYAFVTLLGTSAIQVVVCGDDGCAAQAQDKGFETALAPLLVALTIVGLLPHTGIVARLEGRARQIAQQAAGIPDELFDLIDRMRNAKFPAEQMLSEQARSVLTTAAQERLSRALALIDRIEGGSIPPHQSALAQAVIKLAAFQVFSSNPGEWPEFATRRAFRRIEEEVREAADDALEALSRFEPAPQQGETAEAHAARWRATTARISAAHDSLCGLFALYVERSESEPMLVNPISNFLRRLIDSTREARTAVADQRDALLFGLGGMVVLMLGAGFLGQAFGVTRYPGGSPAWASVVWALGAVMNFGFSGFVAWDMRRDLLRRGWVSAARRPGGRWAFPAGQHLSVFLSAWFVATLAMWTFILFLGLLREAMHGDGANYAQRFVGVLWGFFSIEGRSGVGGVLMGPIYALLGGVHGVMLCVTLDYADEAQRRADADGRRPAARAEAPTPFWRVAGSHGAALVVAATFAAALSGRNENIQTDEGRMAGEALRSAVCVGLAALKEGEGPVRVAKLSADGAGAAAGGDVTTKKPPEAQDPCDPALAVADLDETLRPHVVALIDDDPARLSTALAALKAVDVDAHRVHAGLVLARGALGDARWSDVYGERARAATQALATEMGLDRTAARAALQGPLLAPPDAATPVAVGSWDSLTATARAWSGLIYEALWAGVFGVVSSVLVLAGARRRVARSAVVRADLAMTYPPDYEPAAAQARQP